MQRVSRMLVVMLVLTALSEAQEGVRKFSLHGFMDMSLEKDIHSDGSMYKFIGLDENLNFRLDHVNLYFDFKPNTRLRGLAEVRFLTQPHGSGGAPGLITTMHWENSAYGDTTITETDSATAAQNNDISDDASGGFVTWGGISLERVWMEVMLNQYMNLRIGKFITPAGIWNVDHGSPVITSVQSPYMFSFLPLYPISQVGFMARGMAFVGDIDLDYSLTLSTGRTSLRVADNRYQADLGLTDPTDLAVGVNVGAAFPVLSGIDLGFTGYTGMLRDQTAWTTLDFVIDWASRDESVSDQFGSGFSDPDNKEYWYEDRILAREIDLGIDLELRPVGGLELQSEFVYQQLQNQLDDDAQTHTFGVYAMGRYKFRPAARVALTPYIMYERLWAEDAVNNPASWFYGKDEWYGQVMDAFSIYTAGLNVNLFSFFTTKLEYNFIDAHTVNAQGAYQDIWDVHKLNAQFVLAF